MPSICGRVIAIYQSPRARYARYQSGLDFELLAAGCVGFCLLPAVFYFLLLCGCALKMALRWARFAEEESWPRWPSVAARFFNARHLGFAKRLPQLTLAGA